MDRYWPTRSHSRRRSSKQLTTADLMFTNVARALSNPHRTRCIVEMVDRERPFLLRVYLGPYPEVFDLEVIVTNIGFLRHHTRKNLRKQRACRIKCNLLTASF